MRTTCIVVMIVMALVGVVNSQTPEFDADRAFADLLQQCSFGPRNPGSLGYVQCRDWMITTLREMGCEVFAQKFTTNDPVSGDELKLTNIIARIDGGGRPLMLCAHWDTRPRADKDPIEANRDTPIIGANDGASGVAVLLEIARIASVHKPNRTLIIALFDGEDLGRVGHNEEYALGSKYWASHQVPEPVDEAILLDMVGDVDLEFQIEYFSERNAPSLRGRLWELARDLELPAFQDIAGPAVQDDHVSLQRVGIPAVDIIDFDYPWWHTLEDTPDKCSAESLSQSGRLLLEFIYGN